MIDSFKQIILIGGMPRSGTTLALNLFRSHPDVTGPEHEWVGVGMQAPKMARLSGIREPRTWVDLERVFAVAFAQSKMQRLGLSVDDVAQVQRDLDLEPGWRAAPLLVFEALRRRTGADRLVMKAPLMELDFHWLDESLRRQGWDARFLYVLRHPYDVYLSYRQRSPEWGRQMLHTDVLRWTGEWRRSTDSALEGAAELGERFRLLRFEDLTGDPEARCAELCEWAGLPQAVDEMTALPDDDESKSSFDDPGRRKKGAVRDLSKRERKGLSEEEEELIRTVCGPRARVLGYDLGPRTDAPPFAEQRVAMAQLTMAQYARFLPVELMRRGARAVKTGYSLLTGKRTQSRW